jgi:hypothetical protein
MKFGEKLHDESFSGDMSELQLKKNIIAHDSTGKVIWNIDYARELLRQFTDTEGYKNVQYDPITKAIYLFGVFNADMDILDDLFVNIDDVYPKDAIGIGKIYTVPLGYDCKFDLFSISQVDEYYDVAYTSTYFVKKINISNFNRLRKNGVYFSNRNKTNHCRVCKSLWYRGEKICKICDSFVRNWNLRIRKFLFCKYLLDNNDIPCEVIFHLPAELL